MILLVKTWSVPAGLQSGPMYKPALSFATVAYGFGPAPARNTKILERSGFLNKFKPRGVHFSIDTYIILL